MKRILLVIICLFFIFSSCKKSGGGDGTTPANSISATVDGVNVNFNTNITAIRDPTYIGILKISGQTPADGARQSIKLTVESGNATKPLVAGTYNSLFTVTIIGFAYLTYDNILANLQGAEYDNDPDVNTTITISSISNTNVQGTLGLATNGGTKVITNGKFNVPISN